MSSRALLLALATCVAGCAREAPRPNLLLITVDTLRADRLALCERLRRELAPALEFEHAYTPRAKTTPAVCSLMSGLYPHEHGVRELLEPLAPDVPLLAERLRDAGWSTAAIVGNYVLGAQRSGLARGFEQWTEDLPDAQRVPPDGAPERRARSLTDGALVALGLEPPREGAAGPHQAALAPGRPWFLWLHYMDPHGAYDPPPEFLPRQPPAPDLIDPAALAADTHEPRPWIAAYNVPPAARLADGRIDAAAVRALYDAEVRSVDAEIGRLLARARQAGLLENTLVVFSADHGESLGEQRYWFEHGRNVSEATCAVPLLVSGPRVRPGRVERAVSLCELAPALLELLGLPPLDARARAAPELARGVPGEERAIGLEKVERAELSKAVQTKAVLFGRWKLVRRYAQVFDPATPARKELVLAGDELYDLARDPREEHDLHAAPPPAAPLARLQAELLRFAAADVRFSDLAQELERERAELQTRDPEALRILKALGY